MSSHNFNGNYGEQPSAEAGQHYHYGTNHPAGVKEVIPERERTMVVMVHVGTLLASYLSGTLLGFVVPLIFWFIYKDKVGDVCVRRAAAGAFNFNFTIWLINVATTVVITATLGIAALLLWPVFIVTTVALTIVHIIAIVKVSKGEFYDYPIQVRILK